MRFRYWLKNYNKSESRWIKDYSKCIQEENVGES